MKKKLLLGLFFAVILIIFVFLWMRYFYLKPEFDSSNLDSEGEKYIVENIKLRVNEEELIIRLEDNSSSRAFVEKLKEGELSIEAHDYGNFEKVGDLGFSLPTNDRRITTSPGDLILYQGNQITLYYDVNTWSFTKLGEVVGKNQDELKGLLGKGNVTFVFFIP